jgi:serine/threonine protein kinase
VQVAPLGKGAFGAVSVVKWDNEYCALKQISKSLVVKSQLVNHIKAEKRIMSECDSPFLVRMRASFQDSQYLYLLMDFVQVRSLFLSSPLTYVRLAIVLDCSRFC